MERKINASKANGSCPANQIEPWVHQDEFIQLVALKMKPPMGHIDMKLQMSNGVASESLKCSSLNFDAASNDDADDEFGQLI